MQKFFILKLLGDEVIFLPRNFKAKFYTPQNCPECGHCLPGFSDMHDEGPWEFHCQFCQAEWSVALTMERQAERSATLDLLHQLDRTLAQLAESPYIQFNPHED